VEQEFLSHFREFLPRLFFYLAVPFYLGLQLTTIAREERKSGAVGNAGSFALDFLGLVFAVGIPAFMIVGSMLVYKFGEHYPVEMGGLFRYGLMFLFFGMWWQFFAVMAMKAYRDRDKDISRMKYLLFYIGASVFISLVAFLGGEWFLKWMSLVFLAFGAPLIFLSSRKMSIAFWAAAAVAFLVQTAGFIYVSSMI